MANDRLRDSLLRNGLTPSAVAERIGVDPKTVERWITQGRAPYPKFRHAVAAMVKESESYLWPDAIPPERAARVAQSEMVTLYPCRSVVPEALWNRLFNEATEQINILVYAGLFLPEQRPKLVRELKRGRQPVRRSAFCSAIRTATRFASAAWTRVSATPYRPRSAMC